MSDFISEWAFDDRLVDLTDTVGYFSNLFDPDVLAWWVRLNAEDRAEEPLCAADGPRDQPRPRLEEPPGAGGLHLEDIPKEWDAFWSFWCDQVQPAVRRATGRDDIWA